MAAENERPSGSSGPSSTIDQLKVHEASSLRDQSNASSRAATASATTSTTATATAVGSSSNSSSSSTKKPNGPKKDPLLILTAGCVAGGIEATATWPLEYIKTQMQTVRKKVVGGRVPGVVSVPQPYNTLIGGLQYTVRKHGFFTLYTGLTPTLLLSLPKVGIRFGTNQQLRNLLQSPDGNVSITASFCAGVLSGIAEAVLVVTPQETIKTRLIKLNMGAWDGIRHVLKVEGPSGLYLGLLSTCLKQGGTNGVRFLFISEWTRCLRGSPQAKLDPIESFAGGVGAGLFAVLATQPFDTVKTRQQSEVRRPGPGKRTLQATPTVAVFRQIIKKEGASTLFAGTIARCARVLPGSGIIFACTDAIYEVLLRRRQQGQSTFRV